MANTVVVTTTAIGDIPTDAASVANGMLILQPPLGFGTAYGIGEPVWGETTSYAVLMYVSSLDVAGNEVEAFGPDASGNLVSLGEITPGWIPIYGDLGNDKGVARDIPNTPAS